MYFHCISIYLFGISLTQEATDNLFRDMMQSMADNNFNALVSNYEEGTKRMMEEPYIFMEWEVPMRYSFGGDCRVYELPTSYFAVQSSFPLKKNSPLVPILNKV